MKINSLELEKKLTKAALEVVSKEEAEYYAKEVVETQIRKSPRSNPLKSSIKDLEACIKNKDKKIEYKVDLPSFISIDFKSHGPLLYIKRIHDELEKRSNINGLAMVAFTNSQNMHTLHTWVQGLAKRGLMAIATCNGGPDAVVPFNGTKGLFGTNPMAYGIPGDNGEIHCVDMATSEIPYFEILDANKNKEALRERSAVDSEGNFTTDASKALTFVAENEDPISNIVPMGGGYKGYYLIYLLEMLTSGLIGMPSSPEMNKKDFVAEEHGSILIAFNPKAMGSEKALKNSVKAINNSLKQQKAKVGESIRTPGQENNKRFFELNGKDIEIDDALIEKIETILK